MITLFVEDDAGITEMYRGQCQDAGLADVEFVETAADAKHRIARGDVGHVICDGNIPAEFGRLPFAHHGFDVLRFAKEHGIKDRWIVSADSDVQRQAIESGLATFGCAKIDAVKKARG